MARIDLYRNVHKGQRALIFELAVELGRTDCGERQEFAMLAGRLRDAILELRKHAENEECFIHPLLHSRAPEIAAALEREHERVEAGFCELEQQLSQAGSPGREPVAPGRDLYLAWCRLVSTYLAHLDAEESVAMPALWQTCSDHEILALIQAFVASRSAADRLHDLRSQAPALTSQERSAYVGSIVRGGSLPAHQIWESLADVLPASDLDRLHADISR